MEKCALFYIVNQRTKNKENWVEKVMVVDKAIVSALTEECYRPAEIMWEMIVRAA